MGGRAGGRRAGGREGGREGGRLSYTEKLPGGSDGTAHYQRSQTPGDIVAIYLSTTNITTNITTNLDLASLALLAQAISYNLSMGNSATA